MVYTNRAQTQEKQKQKNGFKEINFFTGSIRDFFDNMLLEKYTKQYSPVKRKECQHFLLDLIFTDNLP
jgi:hypothetical protein